MVITVGKVVDGKIIVEGKRLPEGRTVGVMIADEEADSFDLSPADEEELLDRIKTVSTSKTVDGDDHLRSLRVGL